MEEEKGEKDKKDKAVEKRENNSSNHGGVEITGAPQSTQARRQS